MIQSEAQRRDDEIKMRALDIKKWGTIGFILLIVAAVIMTNLDKLPAIINSIWGTQTTSNAAQNIAENITKLTGGP